MQVQLDTNICICSSISFRSRIVFFLLPLSHFYQTISWINEMLQELAKRNNNHQKSNPEKKENKKKKQTQQPLIELICVLSLSTMCLSNSAIRMNEWLCPIQYNIHMKIYIHREVMSSLLHMVIYLLAGVMFKIDRSVPTSSLEK